MPRWLQKKATLRLAYGLGLCGFLAASFVPRDHASPIGSLGWFMYALGLAAVILAVWTEGIASDTKNTDTETQKELSGR
jgi:hypothetical protein